MTLVMVQNGGTFFLGQLEVWFERDSGSVPGSSALVGE